MNVSHVIALAVALLGLGAALQGFFLVPLPWKLAGMLLGSWAAGFGACRSLSAWARPQPKAGFAPTQHSGQGRLWWATAALFGATIILVCVSLWVVAVNALRVELQPGGTGTEFWLHAPMQGTEQVRVPLPPRAGNPCKPFDVRPNGRMQATAVLVDWDTVTPSLSLQRFIHPQVVGIRCAQPLDPEHLAIRATPADTEILTPERTRRYLFSIISIGGLTCIALVAALWRDWL